MRIEIAGVLGTGKTTIASLINPDWVIHEDFDSNPFLASFYKNPAKYAFETEFSFLFQHYHQIKESEQKNQVCDFALVQDLAYARMGLEGKRFRLFKNTYQSIIEEVQHPNVLIYLSCEPNIILQRIRKRNRDNEKAVDFSFINLLQWHLEKEIETFISENNVKVIQVNTGDRNFIGNKHLVEEFKEEVLGMLA